MGSTYGGMDYLQRLDFRQRGENIFFLPKQKKENIDGVVALCSHVKNVFVYNQELLQIALKFTCPPKSNQYKTKGTKSKVIMLFCTPPFYNKYHLDTFHTY